MARETISGATKTGLKTDHCPLYIDDITELPINQYIATPTIKTAIDIKKILCKFIFYLSLQLDLTT